MTLKEAKLCLEEAGLEVRPRGDREHDLRQLVDARAEVARLKRRVAALRLGIRQALAASPHFAGVRLKTALAADTKRGRR